MLKLIERTGYTKRLDNIAAEYLEDSISSLIIFGGQLSGKTTLLRRLYDNCPFDKKAFISSCPRILISNLISEFTKDIKDREIHILFADEWGNPEWFREIWETKKTASFRLVCTAHNFTNAAINSLFHALSLRFKRCRVFELPELLQEEKLEISNSILLNLESLTPSIVDDLLTKYTPNHIGDFILYCDCFKKLTSGRDQLPQGIFLEASALYNQTRNAILTHRRTSLSAEYFLKIDSKVIRRSFKH